jgi:hypothetical protein
MEKVRQTYADSLGDMINLDFAPKPPAAASIAAAAAAPAPKPAPPPAAPARPKLSAAEIAKLAAARKK